jgi:IS5 family transposase
MEGKMYRTEDKQQLAFKDFYLPFGGKLNPTNRWVQLAQLIPWEDLEEEYAAGFAIESGQGAPAIPFRTALGALIIKEKLGITDEDGHQKAKSKYEQDSQGNTQATGVPAP